MKISFFVYFFLLGLCAHAQTTLDPNSDWKSLGPNKFPTNLNISSRGNGRIHTIALHPNFTGTNQGNNTILAGAYTCGLWKTTTGGATIGNEGSWQPLTDNLERTGVEQAVFAPIHPTLNPNGNLIYIGTRSLGLLKSEDGGQTWSAPLITATNGGVDFPIYPNGDDSKAAADAPYSRIITKILIHPFAPNFIYVSWRQSQDPLEGKIQNGGVLFSNNGGTSWTRLLGNQVGDPNPLSAGYRLRITDMEFHPVNPETLYVADGSHLLVSTNSGATFQSVNGLIQNSTNCVFNTIRLAVTKAPGFEDNIYVLQSHDTNCQGNLEYYFYIFNNIGNSLFSFSDHSATFFYDKNNSSTYNGKVREPFEITPFAEIIPPATKPSPIVYVGCNIIWRSTDNGLTFIKMPVGNTYGSSIYHVDVHSLVIDPNSTSEANTTIYVGNDGGIYKAIHGGDEKNDWDNAWIGEGLVTTQVMRLSPSSKDGRVITGSFDGNANYYDGNGNWHLLTGGDGLDCAFDGQDGVGPTGATMYLSSNNSDCGGAAFEKFILNQSGNPIDGSPATLPQNATSCEWLSPLKIDPIDHNILYFGGSECRRSLDGGSSFSDISNVFLALPDKTIDYMDISNSRVILTAFESLYNPATPQPAVVWLGVPDENLDYTWLNITPNGAGAGTPTGEKLPGWVIISGALIDPDFSPDDPNARAWITFNNENSIIYETNDGGNTWFDISNNLPNEVIRSITIDKMTKTLYVGTDAGVYYRKSGSIKWIGFDNKLPNAQIWDLEVDYDSKQLLAGTFGRGLWTANLPNCYYDINRTKEITTPEVWSNSVDLEGDLTIKTGQTLTATPGVTLHFPKDASLIIEPGATFICTGCTLTNACDGTMWKGIQLGGNANFNQSHPSQGTLILQYNAVVENAIDAISTALRLPDNSRDITTTGGKIYASDTYFKNNRRAAEILIYTADTSFSFFNYCHFLNDAPMKDPYFNGQGTGAHISIWQTNRVKIEGCTFSTNPTIFNYVNAATGIYSIDADYNVTNCTFNNLSYGIHQENTSGLDFYHTNLFWHDTFDGVHLPVNITGLGSNFNLFDLKINATATAHNPATSSLAGCYFQGTRVIGVSRSVIRNCDYGIATFDVYEDGSLNNNVSYVALNEIQNCQVGVATYSSPQTNNKLYIDCNRFSQNSIASWLKYGNYLQIASATQTVSTYPQGNYFDLPPNPNTSSLDIQNLFGHKINYIYYEKSNGFNVACNDPHYTYLKPSPVSIGVTSSKDKCYTCNYSTTGVCRTYTCKPPKPPKGGKVGKNNGTGLLTTTTTAPPDTATLNALALAAEPSILLMEPPQTALVLARPDLTQGNDRQEAVGKELNLRNVNQTYGEALPLLESLPDTFAKWLLLPHYIKSRQFNKAETLLQTLTPQTSDQIAAHKHFGVLKNLGQSGRNLKQLTPAEVVILEEVAATCTQVAHSARNALHIFDGRSTTNTCTPDLLAQQASPYRYAPQVPDAPKSEASLGAPYPNPTEQSLTVPYQLGENENGQIKLINLYGQTLKTVAVSGKTFFVELSLADLPSGSYIVQLFQGERLIGAKRVIRQ